MQQLSTIGNLGEVIITDIKENFLPITPKKNLSFSIFSNPFNSTTQIEYQLAKDCPVTLIIYNILGQKIKTLVDSERQIAGFQQVTWDGRDDLRRLVSSGVYIYRLKAGSFVISRKLVVMK